MVDYSITLPKSNTVHKPVLTSDQTNINDDVKIALSAFDVDGKNGLSSDELLQAFDYFVNKEKEIAQIGKKGDGVITSKDIEQIIKTDSKFSAIREKFNNDNKVVELLSKIVMTLSAIVTLKDNYKINSIGISGFDGINFDKAVPFRASSDLGVTNTQSEIKVIDGKKVRVCRNNKGEHYVTSADCKFIYTTPKFVAQCLGYESESTWLGLGADKYYTTLHKRTYVPVGNGGHEASDEYKQYMEWNEYTHSFTDGEFKLTGKRIHYLSSR